MAKRLPILLGLILAGSAGVKPVFAHEGEPVGSTWWINWSLEPLVIIGILLTTLIYVRGWQKVSQRLGRGRVNQWRSTAFLMGMLTLGIALISPLDPLADQLFSAHMVQHTILTLVSAPLFVLAMPISALISGLPRRTQVLIGNLSSTQKALRNIWKLVGQPLFVWLMFAGVIWGWHVPGAYSASLNNETIHAIQHLSFLGVSLIFWWVVMIKLGSYREKRGIAAMYLFTTALHTGLLGALITFSQQIWYPVYTDRAAIFGIKPLVDQQLAGTIMWVPSGLVFLVAALGMLKTWLEYYPSSEDPIP